MSDASPAQDKLLACVDCGAQFVFSVRDQAFYQERGYQAPRRCKACRDKRKSSQHQVLGPQSAGDSAQAPSGGAHQQAPKPADAAPAAPSGGGKPRDQHKVSCSACGVETTVPFKPDPSRPVYCRSCYLSRRKGGGKPPAAVAPAAPPPAAVAPAAPPPAAAEQPSQPTQPTEPTQASQQ
jgi:CxxC-x17-CxxC domain-containing protein